MKHLTPDRTLNEQRQFYIKELTDIKLKLAAYALQMGLCQYDEAAKSLADSIENIELAQDHLATVPFKATS